VQEGGDVTTEHGGETPARVPKAANHAGEDPRTAGLTHDWSWTEPTVWTARMLAALEQGVKGGKWYSLIDKVQSETTLLVAFAQVAANRGAAGVDHVSVEHYAKDKDANLRRLSEELRTGRYRPQQIRRHYIPKPGSTEMRPLGIPMRPSYCTLFNSGWNGDTGRVGNPIPQSVICRVGDGDDVWQAKLPLLSCYEAPVDPVINHPHTDAVSFANLFDVERIGGKRRAGNVMLVTDPTDHGDREAPASRAFEAVAVEERDDLIVIVRGCQGTDVSNERIGITNRFSAVRRQA
jgi:hypothetical protein